MMVVVVVVVVVDEKNAALEMCCAAFYAVEHDVADVIHWCLDRSRCTVRRLVEDRRFDQSFQLQLLDQN